MLNTASKVWARVCPLDELPLEKAINVFVNGQRLVIARCGDSAHITQGYCSHMLYPLKGARVADCVLTCDLHGSQFDVRDGGVLNWPLPILDDMKARKRLKTYETRVEDGVVYIAWPARDPSKVRIRF